MTKEEIIKEINQNLACQLATAEGDQPRVRGMMAYRADDRGIVFHTGRTKDLYKQITANPKVELCFFDQKNNRQIRVQGKAVVVDDDALKNEIIEARPFLKPWAAKAGLESIVVFRVVECLSYVWTMEKNFAAKEFIRITA
jgi:pyridoxamine 5'-phosphate oxidase